MSALDGFYTTWDNARQTFGQGTPQSGTDFDKSPQLATLGSGLDAAAPGSKWSGAAAANYSTANADHQKVFTQLAELDRKIAQQVDQSAQVVATGRQNLDQVRQWVTDAANSVPPGKQRDMFLMQIANKGLGQLTDVVQKTNAESNTVAQNIAKLGPEFDALTRDQKFGNGEKDEKGDVDALGNEEKKDEEEAKKRAEQDVQDALAGDQDAAARVESVIGGIKPGQELSPEQGSYLSQMQAQQHGMSVEDLKTAEQRLGDHRDIVANSWQLMSNDDVHFPKTDTKPEALDDPGQMVKGSFDQLPQSVQDALNRKGVDSVWSEVTDPLGPRTENAQDVSTIADIVSRGDETLQTGTKLDDAMLDWSRETLHDQQGPSIFESVGLADDYAEYAAARDGALADVFDSAGRDHQAVSAELASDTGQQFLTDLHTHVWAETPDKIDNQASVHSLISWIGDEANSSNPEVATRAGAAAHAIAVNLDANHELYLKPPALESLGATPNAANLNPALLSADAIALEPYQNALVGDTRGTMGFEPLDKVGTGDLDRARNVFAVIDSEPGAAASFNAAASEKILSHQQAFADAAAAHGPDADTEAGDLKRSALLLGVVNGGAEQEAIARGLQGAQTDQAIYDLKKAGLDTLFGKPFGTEDLPLFEQSRDMIETAILGVNPEPGEPQPNITPYSSQSMVDSTYYKLAEGLNVQPGVSEIPSQFFEDGHLKSPDQISDSDMDTYSTALQRYLFAQGYPNLGEMYDRFYEDGAGK